MTKFAYITNGVVDAISFEPQESPWVEVADSVFAGFNFDGQEFTPPAPPTIPIEQRRASATLTRAEFLNACVVAGIITAEVAEDAASGNWPTAFNTFLAGLTAAQRIEAKATWADGGAVRRSNPLLSLIAAYQEVSDQDLDSMFGIT